MGVRQCRTVPHLSLSSRQCRTWEGFHFFLAADVQPQGMCLLCLSCCYARNPKGSWRNLCEFNGMSCLHVKLQTFQILTPGAKSICTLVRLMPGEASAPSQVFLADKTVFLASQRSSHSHGQSSMPPHCPSSPHPALVITQGRDLNPPTRSTLQGAFKRNSQYLSPTTPPGPGFLGNSDACGGLRSTVLENLGLQPPSPSQTESTCQVPQACCPLTHESVYTRLWHRL